MAESEQTAPPADSHTRAQQIEDQLAGEANGELEVEAAPDQAEPEAEEAAPEGTSPDLEEVEFEGEQYQLPKKLKEGLLRETDYRRKTQEIAKQRQNLELKEQALEQANIERKFMEAVKEPVLEFNKISAQLDQYRSLNWQTLSTEDLLRARAEMDRLNDERSRVASSIEGQRGNFTKQQQQLQADLIRKSEEVVRQRIPGWSEQTAKGLADYALGEGYSLDEVKGIVEPKHAITLWKAQQYDKLQAEKGKTLTKVQAAPKVVKPGPSNRPMPQTVKDNLAFRKAIKAAPSSSAKARVIEDQMAASFNRKGRY